MAPIHPASPAASERRWADDPGAILASALSLQQAARNGSARRMLHGRQLALLCESPGYEGECDAALFRQAAAELGAHVAHIRPSLTELSTPEEVGHTARMLGRLYSAMECQDMAPELVQRVGRAAGVPVFDGVASSRHPTAKLAELLGSDAPLAERRRLIVQAVLLATLT